MKAMAADEQGRSMADAELHNEQLMRDAKQQANQGNLVMGEGGRMVLKSDDELGGQAKKYWWGQNEREVSIKCRVPKSLRAMDVRMATASRRVQLQIAGDTICDGELHASIISDESTFTLEDDTGGRLLTVTMTKAQPTKGHEHWKCVVKGQAVIDTSAFGVPLVTVNPNDRNEMLALQEQMNSSEQKTKK